MHRTPSTSQRACKGLGDTLKRGYEHGVEPGSGSGQVDVVSCISRALAIPSARGNNVGCYSRKDPDAPRLRTLPWQLREGCGHGTNSIHEAGERHGKRARSGSGEVREGFGDVVAEATFSLAIQAPIKHRSPKPPRPFPPLPCPSGTLHPLTTHPSSPPGSFPSCTCLSHPIIVGSVEVALETSRRVTDASIRSFLDQSR